MMDLLYTAVEHLNYFLSLSFTVNIHVAHDVVRPLVNRAPCTPFFFPHFASWSQNFTFSGVTIGFTTLPVSDCWKIPLLFVWLLCCTPNPLRSGIVSFMIWPFWHETYMRQTQPFPFWFVVFVVVAVVLVLVLVVLIRLDIAKTGKITCRTATSPGFHGESPAILQNIPQWDP